MSDLTEVEAYEAFFERVEPRLRLGLTAAVGVQAGRDATADALSYGWEHWDRIREMNNPAGYLYRVGRDRARRSRRRRPVAFPPIDVGRTPWIEPDLPEALAGLPEQQRVVVILLYCLDWTMTEVAELLRVSKSTVQTHAERGLSRLRDELGVTS